MRPVADYPLAEMVEQAAGVVRYRSESDGVAVVVQVITGAASDDAFERATRALRAVHAARSPHIVPILDAGIDRGRLYSVSPHYPAGSLDTRRDGDLPRVVLAALGIHDLHEVGVVHRDIRPSSVVRDGEGAAVGGLGLQALLWPGMTTTGFGPLGSLEFADPDLLLGHPAGRHTDIWALGALAHRVATDVSVRPGDAPTDAATAVLAAVNSDPEISPRCDPAVATVVRRALERDAADRYPTALDFAHALAAAIGVPCPRPSA